MIFFPFPYCHIVSLCAVFRIDSLTTCGFCYDVDFFIHHVSYNVLFYLACCINIWRGWQRCCWALFASEPEERRVWTWPAIV